MAFTIYGTQTGAGAQYTPTPMPAQYSVPIGQPLPNRPITPESMDVNANGCPAGYGGGYLDRYGNTVPCQKLSVPQGQTVVMQGLPDNFFGFVMLMMGL